MTILPCAVCAADAVTWDGTDGHQGLRCAEHAPEPRPFEVRDLTMHDRTLWDHELRVDADLPAVYVARLVPTRDVLNQADGVRIIACGGEIILTGDWAPDDGVIGRAGDGGAAWFARDHAPDFLAGRFLLDVFRDDLLVSRLLDAEAELRDQIAGEIGDDVERQEVEIRWAALDMLVEELGADPRAAELDDQLRSRISAAVFRELGELDVYGPTPDHVQHLFAIQRRFRVLYQRAQRRARAGGLRAMVRRLRTRLLLGGA